MELVRHRAANPALAGDDNVRVPLTDQCAEKLSHNVNGLAQPRDQVQQRNDLVPCEDELVNIVDAEENFEGRAQAKNLKLAPKLALLAPDAVHDPGNILKVLLHFHLQLIELGLLPCGHFSGLWLATRKVLLFLPSLLLSFLRLSRFLLRPLQLPLDVFALEEGASPQHALVKGLGAHSGEPNVRQQRFHQHLRDRVVVAVTGEVLRAQKVRSSLHGGLEGEQVREVQVLDPGLEFCLPKSVVEQLQVRPPVLLVKHAPGIPTPSERIEVPAARTQGTSKAAERTSVPRGLTRGHEGGGVWTGLWRSPAVSAMTDFLGVLPGDVSRDTRVHAGDQSVKNLFLLAHHLL
mmetsp:Transcript_9203/g.26169  ORF Transcript_9203/g.26169 Transcript_9203/m.26169 type:complete len:348 (+) Transcript_9203:167-1210(+)